MRLQVSGKQIDVGDALRTHVEDRLDEAVSKYFDRPVEAFVTFSKDRHEFIADLSVHLPTGLSVQAKARANDVYASFEGAVDRMEKQLRRYKRRLKNHHHHREDPIQAIGEPSYILDGGQNDEAEPESLQPVIIAEMETKISNISVGEAVMQMELAGAPLLVFRNEKHGGVNVVYTREDGNIGWIDPRNSQQTVTKLPEWSPVMELSEIVRVDAVRSPVKATSKKRLLQDLSDMADTVYGLPAASTYKALMEREALGPTGVGRGVAIPHARFDEVDKVVGFFIRLEKPIDFESVDRQSVDLVFALFAPRSAGAEHLKALARVSRTLRDERVCAKLRSTFDPAALYAILTEGNAEKAA